jgi:SAM-dependent methyltransferase
VFERVLVPVYLPRGMFARLTAIKRILVPPKASAFDPPINLSGERNVEWAYIASRLPVGNGYVLDFGAGNGEISMHAVQKGHHVVALDLEQNPFHWTHPNLERICGDLLSLELPASRFDFVVNCSTVEHVGLMGRYGVVVEENDGDLAAMSKLRQFLKPSGKMLMTVPCGRDSVFSPWHRVYGERRLPRLLEAYEIEEEYYWRKNADNCWCPADRESALSFPPTGHPAFSYALGCFVLRRTER